MPETIRACTSAENTSDLRGQYVFLTQAGMSLVHRFNFTWVQPNGVRES